MPLVVAESQHLVGVHGVQATILQGVGTQLVGQADTAPLLGQIKQYPAAHRLDVGHRVAQLFAAVAAQTAEQVTGQARRVQAQRHCRLPVAGLTDHHRDVLTQPIRLTKQDKTALGGLGQRNPRLADTLEQARRAVEAAQRRLGLDAQPLAGIDTRLGGTARRAGQLEGERCGNQQRAAHQRQCSALPGIRRLGQCRHPRLGLGAERQALQARQVQRTAAAQRQSQHLGLMGVRLGAEYRQTMPTDHQRCLRLQLLQTARLQPFQRLNQRRRVGVLQYHWYAAAKIEDSALDVMSCTWHVASLSPQPRRRMALRVVNRSTGATAPRMHGTCAARGGCP